MTIGCERGYIAPTDFDPRFHQSAPADQLTHLEGDEPVRAKDLYGIGLVEFRLPGRSMVVSGNVRSRYFTERAGAGHHDSSFQQSPLDAGVATCDRSASEAGGSRECLHLSGAPGEPCASCTGNHEVGSRGDWRGVDQRLGYTALQCMHSVRSAISRLYLQGLPDRTRQWIAGAECPTWSPYAGARYLETLADEAIRQAWEDATRSALQPPTGPLGFYLARRTRQGQVSDFQRPTSACRLGWPDTRWESLSIMR